MKKNTLYAFPVVIVVAILLALGLVGGGLLKKVNSVTTLTGALTIYDGLVKAADVYVTDCAEKIIPQSCVPTARQVVADVDATKAAYAALKAAGANPPTNVAQTLIDAVNVLQTALPATAS